MKKNIKFLLALMICIGLILSLVNPYEKPPADKLNIEVASGYDVIPVGEKDVQYELTREFAVMEENNKLSRKVANTVGNTIGHTRQLWSLTADKEKVIGFVKVYVLSDSFARHGISTLINSQFKDTGVNDTAIFVVCKGKSSSILNYKPKETRTTGDFIEEQIKNHKGYNFFSNEYTEQNMFARLDSEGRNLKIPHIELKEDGIEISGMAIFKKDKMVALADIKNTRIMNMLLNNNVSGIVTLNNDNNRYIDFRTITRRKVKCKKINGKYNFTIDLTLNGDIATNTALGKPISKILEEKTFEKLMEEHVKKQCDEFIIKMKNEYKVDCLELGRVAASKYGRRTGTDWDKVVMDSNIQVNVYVKLDKQGRGNY